MTNVVVKTVQMTVRATYVDGKFAHPLYDSAKNVISNEDPADHIKVGDDVVLMYCPQGFFGGGEWQALHTDKMGKVGKVEGISVDGIMYAKFNGKEVSSLAHRFEKASRKNILRSIKKRDGVLLRCQKINSPAAKARRTEKRIANFCRMFGLVQS